jgi:ADP-L-glycero-D-manno-heptose 6-epimerase
MDPARSTRTGWPAWSWQAYRQIIERSEVALFRSTDRSYPDGGQLRDFVYVEDNLDHMCWLWQHPEVCGIFNSGTGREHSFLDLVHATFGAMDRPPKVRFVEMPEDLRGRYQNFTRAETGKLAEAGYPGRPTSLDEGVSRYVRWHTERCIKP